MILWIDFLIHILHTHAQSLKQLSALLGEAKLVELLENLNHTPDEKHLISLSELSDQSIFYTQLEENVQQFYLSSSLESHLWAYPFYRSIIESGLNLNTSIETFYPKRSEELVDSVLSQAQSWIHRIPFPSHLQVQAEQVAWTPWLRWRAQTLQKLGRRSITFIG